MSDKAAAAQKWAETRDVLEAAANSLEQAAAAHKAADAAEREAWVALEALAGRAVATPYVPVSVTAGGGATAGGTWGPPRNHDLPVRPLG